MTNAPEENARTSESPVERRGGALLYRLSLWLLVVILVAALASCAAGSRENGADSSAIAVKPAGSAPGSAGGEPMRLLLGGNESLDSISLVTDYVVDQVVRQISDSIPGAEYQTINKRDSLVSQATEITLAELGRRLDLDGVIYTRTARFGQTLALELRVIDPSDGRLLFRDLSFVTIRFRDSEGSMLIGPALYAAVRKSMRAYFGLEHTRSNLAATEPISISGIRIAPDGGLARITKDRGRLAEGATKALADYAVLHFPEIVPLDPLSRDRMYESLKLGRVESTMGMLAVERDALLSVGIERYLSGVVEASGAENVRFALEIHQIAPGGIDTIIDKQDVVLARSMFETSTMEQEVMVTLIDLAEPLFNRESERVRSRYAEKTKR